MPFPIPGDLPDAGIKPMSLEFPALAGGFFTTEPSGKPLTRDQTHTLCFGRQSLNHWTARQVPHLCIFIYPIPHLVFSPTNCFKVFCSVVYMCVCVCVCVCVCTHTHAQLCLTLCDPMNCSLPVSLVCGISQARILEWVAISYSKESS